jgi:hypothetical protein
VVVTGTVVVGAVVVVGALVVVVVGAVVVVMAVVDVVFVDGTLVVVGTLLVVGGEEVGVDVVRAGPVEAEACSFDAVDEELSDSVVVVTRRGSRSTLLSGFASWILVIGSLSASESALSSKSSVPSESTASVTVGPCSCRSLATTMASPTASSEHTKPATNR